MLQKIVKRAKEGFIDMELFYPNVNNQIHISIYKLSKYMNKGPFARNSVIDLRKKFNFKLGNQIWFIIHLLLSLVLNFSILVLNCYI